MVKTENFQQVEVESQQELRQWLGKNHTQKESVWLVTYKKESGDKYVSTSQVLDELLCFGWIDGIRRKLDEQRTMQLISPRKSHHWTQSYKDRFERLEQEGKMTDAGRKMMTHSKANQLWNLMDDVDALEIPADFKTELKKHPPAVSNFKAFAISAQRFTLRWIKLAKTDATRKKRMTQAATLAAVNKKIPGL